MWQLTVAGILTPFLLAVGGWWLKEVLTGRRKLWLGGIASVVLLALVIGLSIWGLRPGTTDNQADRSNTPATASASAAVSDSAAPSPSTTDVAEPTSVDQCHRPAPAGSLSVIAGKAPYRHELYTWVAGCIIKLNSAKPDWEVYLRTDWSDGALWSTGQSISTNANIGEVSRGQLNLDSCGEAWSNREKNVSVMHDGLKFCIFPGPKAMVIVRHISPATSTRPAEAAVEIALWS
ncbi:hypothetical protein [Catellatospora tritici]|uniref:hypothetical protein n=1 Tax=Catellatospora tritici TaxID=2851566 RepID=UPI001C2CD6BB|nr:hypothetical protein [Catellatospora tritici]MBV1855892.1 hypothetical protein [Catellatospora tritici]